MHYGNEGHEGHEGREGHEEAYLSARNLRPQRVMGSLLVMGSNLFCFQFYAGSNIRGSDGVTLSISAGDEAPCSGLGVRVRIRTMHRHLGLGCLLDRKTKRHPDASIL